MPADLTYRSKNALALDLVDEALARKLPPAPVLADSAQTRRRLHVALVRMCCAPCP